MTEQIAGDITLKTAPECMRKQAYIVADEINAMTDVLGELETIVSRTAHYWIGEAGDHYRMLYEENKKEIHEILTRFMEYPGQLMQAAQIYEEENRDEMAPNPLPGDIIP